MDYSRERLDDLLVSFRRHLRAENKSPRTLKLYCTAVERFADRLGTLDREPVLGEFTRAAIQAHLADLNDSGLAPSSVGTHFAGLKRFSLWLVQEEYLPADPMAKMHKPESKEKPVPVFTDDDLKALLRACEGTTFEDRRDMAIMRVLLDCGVRISELAGLRVADVDLKQYDAITVTGKRGKTRSVPFGDNTAKALERYLRDRRAHRHADSEALWLGQRGAMSVWGVDERIRRRAEAAGLDGVHAHRFRHTAAADWLASGGQERDLMRLMGWDSEAMLAVYGRATADQRAQDAKRRMRRGDRV